MTETTMAQTGDDARTVTLSDNAAKRIRALRELEGDSGLMLRLAISGGGCSGFQYGFTFDASVNDDDHIFEREDVRLVIDEISLDLLAGSEVDYVEDLIGSAFRVTNPNAVAGCGCGNSFAI